MANIHRFHKTATTTTHTHTPQRFTPGQSTARLRQRPTHIGTCCALYLTLAVVLEKNAKGLTHTSVPRSTMKPSHRIDCPYACVDGMHQSLVVFAEPVRILGARSVSAGSRHFTGTSLLEVDESWVVNTWMPTTEWTLPECSWNISHFCESPAVLWSMLSPLPLRLQKRYLFTSQEGCGFGQALRGHRKRRGRANG